MPTSREYVCRFNLFLGGGKAANLAGFEFLSSKSHELRTPMNAIIEFTRMLGIGNARRNVALAGPFHFHNLSE